MSGSLNVCNKTGTAGFVYHPLGKLQRRYSNMGHASDIVSLDGIAKAGSNLFEAAHCTHTPRPRPVATFLCFGFDFWLTILLRAGALSTQHDVFQLTP